MGAVLRICPSRQPASRARVASRINEPRSPSAVMRQVLFEDEDSQAIVVPSGDESTEAERSGSSSQSRQVDADSKVKKARRRRGEVLEDMDAWHCAQSIGEAAGCLSSASASVTKLALRVLHERRTTARTAHCGSAEVVRPELRTYWDQHNGSRFDERSVMGGRLEPLRRVAQVAEALLCRAHGGWTTVVDLGCGTGLFAQFLANVPGLRVVGVDLSEGHLQVARRHMEVIKASYLDWEPDDWTPDVAVHNNSIEDYEESSLLPSTSQHQLLSQSVD
eukprot:g14160.t1